MANLFAPIPPEITEEIIQVLLATGNFRLERIVSTRPGHAAGGMVRPGHPRVGGAPDAAPPDCALRTRRNPGYCAPATTSSFRPTAATGWSGPTPGRPPSGWPCITGNKRGRRKVQTQWGGPRARLGHERHPAWR